MYYEGEKRAMIPFFFLASDASSHPWMSLGKNCVDGEKLCVYVDAPLRLKAACHVGDGRFEGGRKI